jgi:hypothetical protein
MIAFARNLPTATDVQARFLELLPTIRTAAQVAFRGWDAEAREDAVTEVIANCYVAFARLAARDKIEVAFATVLARFAIRQLRVGRRVGSRFTVQDVMSPVAQRRRRFAVEQLDSVDPTTDAWLDSVVEDTSTPVADQAAFRCDFPAWLSQQRRRTRRIAEALALGHTTNEVARRFRLSPGRISQLRSELRNSWQTFHGETLEKA